jgi:hypothetical protein
MRACGRLEAASPDAEGDQTREVALMQHKEPATAMQLARWRFLLRALALFLGATFCAAAIARESMNADGMNYLDQGDAWWSGDWSVAINPVWSPLYPWILGAVLRLTDPAIAWEFPTVHLVNFAIYAGSLACFEYFWRQLSAAYARGTEGSVGLPERTWMCLGYALFIWSSLTLIEIWSVTPDQLVACAVMLASGLLIRIREGWATGRTYAALGAVLGLGYLAKAVLFPMSLVFLAVAVWVHRDRWQGLRDVCRSLVCFLLVAGPFLITLSVKEGHVTFSDVGNLTYLKHVHGIDTPHQVPARSELGTPLHLVSRLSVDPTVWSFGGEVGGTYPLAYDPYHWYQGLVPSVSLRQQLTGMAEPAAFYFDLIFLRQGGVLAVVALLVAYAYGSGWRWSALKDRMDVVWVAVAALGMYALVHVTWRYIGPYMVLFWSGLLALVRLPEGLPNRRLLAIAGAAITFFVAVDFVHAALGNARPLLASWLASERVAAPVETGAQEESELAVHARPSRIALGLVELGLRPGDRVGFVGYSYDAYWARLARLRIVAEILPPEAKTLWTAGATQAAAVLGAFERAGARAVVAASVPERTAAGWERVADTSYHVRFLEPRGREPSRASD